MYMVTLQLSMCEITVVTEQTVLIALFLDITPAWIKKINHSMKDRGHASSSVSTGSKSHISKLISGLLVAAVA